MWNKYKWGCVELAEITLNDLLQKFNLKIDLSNNLLQKSIKYFTDKTVDELLNYYEGYHTEEVDDKTITVFEEKVNGKSLELIIDPEDMVVSEFEVLEDGTREVLFSYTNDETEITYN